MPGREIVEHKILLDPDARPLKQKRRRLGAKWADAIKEEIEKHMKAGFLEVTYSDWVFNIVPMAKKNGKVRMCVDNRNQNKASPKHDFPLPHIDLLVGNAASGRMPYFMDGSSEYSQVLLAKEDMAKMTFTREWGLYCYRVQPFGSKNAGTTNQRMAPALLHDIIHKEVEFYMDHMIVKSHDRLGHGVELDKFLA
ncbi:hypothetical protein CRG98_028249 [Punica granatum]|uniref:Reverse transcriptase domain-containing protein n=1 Tax=Punica granatum TaxID=22663 RepID=A0A2I0J573_PUNGR|nr:hypothetical protein CRG98_028249 [Punica granatum]